MRHGLALVAGVAALTPLALVDDADAKRRKLGTRTLSVGMKGTDVRVLQDYLTRLGFRTSVDGRFGPDTRRRVRTFERTEQLRIDGRLTRTDSRRLRVVAENAGGPARQQQAAANALMTNPLTLPTAPGPQVQLTESGLALAPAGAPPQVRALIAAANQIASKPYVYGGGHGRWDDKGYDCSGSVSYALHGAGLLEKAMASGGFTKWGDAGTGQWVTIYANAGHMYMTVAGARFDTSGAKQAGSRWQMDSRPSKGYDVRHPPGF